MISLSSSLTLSLSIAIRFMNFKHPLVYKILEEYTTLSERDRDIVFMVVYPEFGIVKQKIESRVDESIF